MIPQLADRPALAGRAHAALLLLALMCALLAGCGGGDNKVIATVGDREVTADYYEERLAKLKLEELPRGDDGLPVDTSTEAGKREFLDVIVNKELMALKAADLGFDSDEQVSKARDVITEFKAGELMHNELIKGPAQDVSDADIDAYYAKLGTTRKFRFVICNFRDDAVAAREKLMTGDALWEDVADEYNDGSRGPNGDYSVTMQYGRVEDAFENVLFNLDVGEISQPVETVYGYWILRLDEIQDTPAPPMDEAFREKVRESIRARRVNLARKAFIKESEAKHHFSMDETALWIVYQGMPEKEDYLDPVTQKPVAQSELQPLDVPTEEMDRVFWTVQPDLDAEPETWTVGDYKQAYDAMTVFQRPKRNQLLGGVRRKIVEDMIDRALLIAEARERGYFERPEVVGDATQRAEQAMVTKLHEEVVKIDERITPEQLDAFWEEHRGEYVHPENRKGRVVYTTSRDAAEAAQAMAAEGRSWEDVLAAYGENPDNKKGGGHVEIAATGTGQLRDAMFALPPEGGLSMPFPVEGGWGVCRVDSVEPSHNMELDEVRAALGNRIKAVRKNEALNALLAEWRDEYGVVINDGALAGLRSWEELQAANATDEG